MLGTKELLCAVQSQDGQLSVDSALPPDQLLAVLQQATEAVRYRCFALMLDRLLLGGRMVKPINGVLK